MQKGLIELKLYIKQKVFSWNDKFTVTDENGNDRFTAAGKLPTTFVTGKHISVSDENGNTVASVRHKMKGFSLAPRFIVEVNGREVCEVVKKFTFFSHKYNIEGLSWQLEGDFTGHDYEVQNGSQVVMKLSKKLISLGDSYELDIADPNNELICLCIALAVDCSLAAPEQLQRQYRRDMTRIRRG